MLPNKQFRIANIDDTGLKSQHTTWPMPTPWPL